MMNFQNPYINPFGVPQPFQSYPQAPVMQQQQVTRVNGENGARAYSIGANSSAMLLDEGGMIVWLVTTDGAGYKTVTPYDIKPHRAEPAPDFGSLENRVKRLEELIHDTADTSAAGRRAENITANHTDDKDDQIGRRSADDAPTGAANASAAAAGHGDRTRLWRGRE